MLKLLFVLLKNLWHGKPCVVCHAQPCRTIHLSGTTPVPQPVLHVVNNRVHCTFCGERQPEFMCFPGIASPFCEGYRAAKAHEEFGSNPHWTVDGEKRHSFAVAGWNLGWMHAINCGTPKEVET